MATGDLNEYKILELVAAGAPIDVFGVGTELATQPTRPASAPSTNWWKSRPAEKSATRPSTAKTRARLPGAKQIFRFADHDVLACAWEHHPGAEALLRPIMLDGKLAAPLPCATQAREHARTSLDKLPGKLKSLFEVEPPWPVDRSEALNRLSAEVRQKEREVAR